MSSSFNAATSCNSLIFHLKPPSFWLTVNPPHYKSHIEVPTAQFQEADTVLMLSKCPSFHYANLILVQHWPLKNVARHSLNIVLFMKNKEVLLSVLNIFNVWFFFINYSSKSSWSAWTKKIMNHPVSFPSMAATSTPNPSDFIHCSPSAEIRTESLLAPRQLQRHPSGKHGNFHVQIWHIQWLNAIPAGALMMEVKEPQSLQWVHWNNVTWCSLNQLKTN